MTRYVIKLWLRGPGTFEGRLLGVFAIDVEDAPAAAVEVADLSLAALKARAARAHAVGDRRTELRMLDRIARRNPWP